MAEPPISYARRLAEIFLSEYNKDHDTNFQWIDEKSYKGKDGDVDIILFDDKEELTIQHTRAVADPIIEYVKPSKIWNTLKLLEEQLIARPEIPPIHIMISMHNPPSTKEETVLLSIWLTQLIEEKTISESLSLYKYDKDDEAILPYISKHVSWLNILPMLPEDGKKIGFSYGSSEEKIKNMLTDAQRIIQAISKKLNSKHLLLVEAGSWGVYESQIEEIVEYSKTTKLKEIWVVEPFLQQERAFRVK